MVSDDPEGHLPTWLLNRIDRGFRLRHALQSPAVVGHYDCVLIDTQGAIGPWQDAAVMAADILSRRRFTSDEAPATVQNYAPADEARVTIADLDRFKHHERAASRNPFKPIAREWT